jgi:hypothetical protein
MAPAGVTGLTVPANCCPLLSQPPVACSAVSCIVVRWPTTTPSSNAALRYSPPLITFARSIVQTQQWPHFSARHAAIMTRPSYLHHNRASMPHHHVHCLPIALPHTFCPPLRHLLECALNLLDVACRHAGQPGAAMLPPAMGRSPRVTELRLSRRSRHPLQRKPARSRTTPRRPHRAAKCRLAMRQAAATPPQSSRPLPRLLLLLYSPSRSRKPASLMLLPRRTPASLLLLPGLPPSQD